MDKAQFKVRTQKFALNIIVFVEELPRDTTSNILGKQLLRSATSVGANYRAACRAKSTADFISKMGIVEEEADECLYWLELLINSRKTTQLRVADLMMEADELLVMTVSSIRTARQKILNPNSAIPNR